MLKKCKQYKIAKKKNFKYINNVINKGNVNKVKFLNKNVKHVKNVNNISLIKKN